MEDKAKNKLMYSYYIILTLFVPVDLICFCLKKCMKKKMKNTTLSCIPLLLLLFFFFFFFFL